MPLTIKNLTSNVRIESTQRHSNIHEPAQPNRPSMEYAMPITEHSAHGEPDPSQTATLGKGAASNRSPISARDADPHKVADRVYELMKREIILGRQRGGLNYGKR